MKNLLCLFLLILSACTPQVQETTPQVITYYATSAAEPWLSNLFGCADKLSVVLNVSAALPDITLRVGESDTGIIPAYRIDEEEILVVTHRESPVQNLSLVEIRDLFAQGNPSLQIWVYASEADLQRVFDQLVMQGRSVSSSARIAVSAQNMSDVLKSNPAAIGILPRQWITGDMREVLSVGVVPVLAVAKEKPQSVVGKLLSCLQ